MRNLAQKQKIENNNVVQFPNIQTKPEFIHVTLQKNIYGLCEGDTLKCKTDWKVEDIKRDSLCVVRRANDIVLLSNVQNDDRIIGVVVSFERSL